MNSANKLQNPPGIIELNAILNIENAEDRLVAFEEWKRTYLLRVEADYSVDKLELAGLEQQGLNLLDVAQTKVLLELLRALAGEKSRFLYEYDRECSLMEARQSLNKSLVIYLVAVPKNKGGGVSC